MAFSSNLFDSKRGQWIQILNAELTKAYMSKEDSNIKCEVAVIQPEQNWTSKNLVRSAN